MHIQIPASRSDVVISPGDIKRQIFAFVSRESDVTLLFTRLHPESKFNDDNLSIIGVDCCATLLSLVPFITSSSLRYITPLTNTDGAPRVLGPVRTYVRPCLLRVRLTFPDRDLGRVRLDTTWLLDLARIRGYICFEGAPNMSSVARNRFLSALGVAQRLITAEHAHVALRACSSVHRSKAVYRRWDSVIAR